MTSHEKNRALCKISIFEKKRLCIHAKVNASVSIKKGLSFQQNKVYTLTLYPKGKIINWARFNAFAEEIINLAKKLKFILGRVENILGKGENAGYQHFLLFPHCFQKLFFSGSFKVRIVW